MRTIILYESQTGSTKKYAEDIARAVSADVFPLKKFKLKKLKDYDTIVFGGWVMGGAIQGLNKFLTVYDDIKDKNVILFSSGMSVSTPEGRQDIIDANLLDMYHVRYYELRGDFDFQRLNFLYKMMMNRTFQAIENNPDAPVNQKALLTVKTTPLYFYDQEKVDKIIRVINSLSVIDVTAKDK